MLLIAFGTRPEWIKLKPVIDEIRNKIPFKILYTGQHIDIIDDSLKNYTYGKIEIANDISSNRLDSVVSSIMSQIDQHLEGVTHVMIQGDTTTVFAVALTCFHRGIKVIHLEAGLRTYDNQHPFPEEFNRFFIDKISSDTIWNIFIGISFYYFLMNMNITTHSWNYVGVFLPHPKTELQHQGP